ncbi:hypothetical protein GRI44_04345 [Altererythrobacter confluentis]|uniref:Peptidase inhibitor I78 family protein n=1 Tax=Allopontixanthobacter confluentis TaxID=1849021 RepID=A0A6L7GET0_9SPHN|nr:hypothetical protein [Allopontixanthobacter confluentis]
MTYRARIAALGLFPAIFIALAACGNADQQTETADDFAARVNGAPVAANTSATGQPGQQYAPQLAAPVSGAAAGPPEARRQTDPASASCGANRGAKFLGQPASDQINAEISQILPAGATMRVVSYGEAVDSDFRNARLNIMLDAGGIIRDLRCG